MVHMSTTKTLKIFGSPVDEGAVKQIENVLEDERAVAGALMADHHLGYSMPIGGVVAYEDAISPTGVGFDIACGNKAVRTNLNMTDFFSEALPFSDESQRKLINTFKPFMRQVQKKVSFGIGRTSGENVDHELFDNPIWDEIDLQFVKGLKDKARQQLGTVGSGNHYVDLLVDEGDGQIWIANHFGSRGLGHTIASAFMAYAAGYTFTDKVPESEEAVVLDTNNAIGQFYIECMKLAGEYAYAGRDYVADQVLQILGATSEFEVHNHHNFAWLEDGKWVVRKGATPLTTAPAFIGGSMGDISVIVRGRGLHVPENTIPGFTADRPSMTMPAIDIDVMDIGALGSAPHGAGRVMSRTQAAGKLRKMWYCGNRNCDFEPFHQPGNAMTPYEKNRCPKCNLPLRKGRMRDQSTAKIDWASVRYSLEQQGIVVLGAGADEAPGVYKDLGDVLGAHSNIEVLHRLRPLGVVMAGANEFDPYKD